jgi:hypothetical protein
MKPLVIALRDQSCLDNAKPPSNQGLSLTEGSRALETRPDLLTMGMDSISGDHAGMRVVPLAFIVNHYLSKPRLRGLRRNLRGEALFRYAAIDHDLSALSFKGGEQP